MNYKEALELAKKCHNGQYRKGSGLPYVTHPIAVADRFEDERYKIVAVLHDVIEDTDMTTFELSFTHKLGMNLVVALEALTRKDNQTYLEYILLCKKTAIARDVKIEDLKHNLSDHYPGERREKYLLALYILEDYTDYFTGYSAGVVDTEYKEADVK